MGGSNNRFRGRRVLAVLGAVTLGLVGAVGAAAPASADDAFGNVDTNKLGSLTIHKHVHQGSATPVEASPAGPDTIPSDPVAGVTFNAYKVNGIDLGTAAGWAAVSALSVTSTTCDTLPPSGTTGAGSAVTDGTGQAKISNLAVGAYIVCETNAPNTVVDKAQPFVVTIPFSYKRASGTPTESWLYDVNVYPKNGVAKVAKTVTAQAELGLGATAAFPVTTDIPTIASNANFTHYYVQDPMDARLTGATVSKVTIGGTDVSSSYYSVSTSGSNLVTVEFTSAGLTWLKTQPGKQIVTTFTGTVATLGNGVFNNTASFSAAAKVGSVPSTPDTPVLPSDPNYPGTHSATITQNWGDLVVNKVDAGDHAAGLTGAKFEVYEATDPYATDCTTATIKTGASAIKVGVGANPPTVFTSSAGVLSIAGLFVSDSLNNPGAGATKRCYVLKEIEAPAGYITPVGAAALTGVAVKTGATDTGVAYDALVTNTRVQGVTLPMTGSNGIVVLSVAGLALIAAGVVLALLARKRSRQTA